MAYPHMLDGLGLRHVPNFCHASSEGASAEVARRPVHPANGLNLGLSIVGSNNLVTSDIYKADGCKEKGKKR